MTLHSIGFVACHYGVSVSTIRRWVEKGILTVALRTFGGHRRFEVEEPSAPEGRERLNIGYARVSSHDQEPDLSRQIERLKAEGCDQVISDIGSGLNCVRSRVSSLFCENFWTTRSPYSPSFTKTVCFDSAWIFCGSSAVE